MVGRWSLEKGWETPVTLAWNTDWCWKDPEQGRKVMSIGAQTHSPHMTATHYGFHLFFN